MNESALEKLVSDMIAAINRYTAPLYQRQENDILTDDDKLHWFDELERLIAEYHQAAALLGRNGNLTPAQQDIIADSITTQLQYLDQFKMQVVSDAEFERGFLARAEMYARAIRSTFYQAVTNFLPLPAMPAEGTICHTNCKCGWNINTLDENAGDFDCYWVRGADDSCSTCIARAREWAPLQIRGWELV